MMRVADVIERLTAILVPDTFSIVSGLGEMPSKPEAVRWNGRAFVLPLTEIAGTNNAGTGVVSQTTVRAVRVLMGFTKMSARRMGNLDSVEDVSEAVKVNLVGWTPAGEASPVIYMRGGVEHQDLEQGLLIWACDFACPYTLEA
jgi:hypothetical protein